MEYREKWKKHTQKKVQEEKEYKKYQFELKNLKRKK